MPFLGRKGERKRRRKEGRISIMKVVARAIPLLGGALWMTPVTAMPLAQTLQDPSCLYRP